MKKLTVVLAVVLLFWTGHADALGLSADVAYFSLVESEYQIEEMTSVGGGVTLLDLGTAELALTGRLIGDPTGLGELARVYLKRPAADPLEDAVLVVGDILVSLKTEPPLTPDIRVAAQAGIGHFLSRWFSRRRTCIQRLPRCADWSRHSTEDNTHSIAVCLYGIWPSYGTCLRHP